jgi:hypothetical protein
LVLTRHHIANRRQIPHHRGIKSRPHLWVPMLFEKVTHSMAAANRSHNMSLRLTTGQRSEAGLCRASRSHEKSESNAVISIDWEPSQ